MRKAISRYPLVLLILLFLSINLNAQVLISNIPGSPDSSAGLEVSFANKGLLPPRMTQTERAAISNPAEGLMIYNTSTGCINVYSLGSWKQLCPQCDFLPPIASSNSPRCVGTALNLSSTLVSGASYQWSGPGGFSSTQQNPIINNVQLSHSGVYTLVVTLNGCSSTPQQINVVVEAPPSVTITPASQQIGSGQSTSLSLSSTSSGATFSWTVSQPAGVSGGAAGSGSIIAQSLLNTGISAATATYAVIASSANGCSGSAVQALVTIGSQTLGSGADGSVAISGSRNINNEVIATGRLCADAVTYSVTALTANTAEITPTPGTGCLIPGDEVLLINAQGINSTYTNTGNYETLIVQSVSGSTVTFTANKVNFYGDGAINDLNIGTGTTNQKVFLQRVPNYTNVTISSGATLSGNSWNGTTGGVLFFRASGTVTVNGVIEMNAKGYRAPTIYGAFGEDPRGAAIYNTTTGHGEDYWLPISQASSNWGGRTSGGGYGTAGGSCNPVDAEQEPGAVYGTQQLSRLYMGSPGGGTYGPYSTTVRPGGGGAGVVAIHGSSIIVNGEIQCGGGHGSGAQTSCTGGGSGGSILLKGNVVSIGSNKVSAVGGVAGAGYGYSNWTAGGGGAGRIAIYYGSSLSGNTNPPAFSQQLP